MLKVSSKQQAIERNHRQEEHCTPGGYSLTGANGDVPLDGVAFSRLG